MHKKQLGRISEFRRDIRSVIATKLKKDFEKTRQNEQKGKI